MGKVVRSKTKMTYHGRSGYPKIHTAKTSGHKYIMVRHPSGKGTKRLYLKKGRVPKQHRKG